MLTWAFMGTDPAVSSLFARYLGKKAKAAGMHQ
jgi:hypothetical protein